MVNERSKRRRDFSQGIAVRLADGQEWWVPAPGQWLGHDRRMADPEYSLLVEGMADAENAVDLARAELALGIYLLDLNYRLQPDDYAELLDVTPGDPRSDAVRVALRILTEGHVPRRDLIGDADGPAVPCSLGWRGVLSRCADRIQLHFQR